MNFTPKYFKEQLPEWKKKKDPVLSRIFYRPVSFYTASFATKLNISANAISYFSAILGIIACVLFVFDNWYARLIGAILVNIWLILDCTDGNIARSVKKQQFGEFADGISSYILVGFLFTTIGFGVYNTGGLLFDAGNPWIIMIGALASSSDSLMRLIYQKYQNTLQNMKTNTENKKTIIDVRNDKDKVGNIRVRVEAELGIGGILPIAILIATIFNALDIVVIYSIFYYGLSFIVSSMLFVVKAIKASNN